MKALKIFVTLFLGEILQGVEVESCNRRLYRIEESYDGDSVTFYDLPSWVEPNHQNYVIFDCKNTVRKIKATLVTLLVPLRLPEIPFCLKYCRIYRAYNSELSRRSVLIEKLQKIIHEKLINKSKAY